MNRILAVNKYINDKIRVSPDLFFIIFCILGSIQIHLNVRSNQ